MSRGLALVVGIDGYPGFGPESQLAGAESDARIMAELLIGHFGFATGDVLRLLGRQATREAVLGGLETLRRRVAAGDRVVLFFSGHGSQMTDRENDEGDGLDETLVPVDSGRDEAENRDVSDDEINAWAARVLGVTRHLTLIFDCCHAATLHRPAWQVRSVPPDLRPVPRLPPSPVPRLRDVDVGPRPLMLAACADDERAFELPPSIAGKDRGAFSFHLVEALRVAAPSATWREVFARVAIGLKKDCPEQHPRLSGDGIDLPIFGGIGAEIGEHADGPSTDPGEGLLALASRPDRFGLEMELFRSRGGAWRRLTDPGGAVASFRAGDRLRVDVRHDHEREIFIYLLDVGLTGIVRLLFPDDQGSELLDPGVTLTVGARSGDRMEIFLPERFDRSEGTGHLVLVGAESRLPTHRWMAGAVPCEGSVSAVVRPYEISRG